MIRYNVGIRELIRLIKRESPDWLSRARTRTKQFILENGYFENEKDALPFWNELKPVYMAIQKSKCIFCERTYEDADYKTIELDVEHYRPKRKVDTWPSPYMRKRHAHLDHYNTTRGSSLTDGYWSLAYHPLNFAVCCLRCNRTYKKNFFPIDQNRLSSIKGQRHLSRFHSEQPDLFYPLSTIDVDNPEVCLFFKGPFVFPVENLPIRTRERVRITIDLLQLNIRPELIRGRCRIIRAMYPHYILSLDNDLDKRATGVQGLKSLILRSEPFCRCAQCYLDLCKNDQESAKSFFLEAVDRLKNLITYTP